MPKTKKPSVLDTVKSTAQELLSHLKIEGTISVSQKDEDIITVNIDSPEQDLLIGFQGETLSSFQLILGLIVYKKLGVWTRVIVEVGDYRAKREEELTEMAKSYADQVANSGQPLVLPSLSPFERRIIHLTLQENPNVKTESVGVGNARRVVIKPKTL